MGELRHKPTSLALVDDQVSNKIVVLIAAV